MMIIHRNLHGWLKNRLHTPGFALADLFCTILGVSSLLTLSQDFPESDFFWCFFGVEIKVKIALLVFKMLMYNFFTVSNLTQ